MPRIMFYASLVMGKARPRILKNGRAYTPAKTASAERAIRDAYCAASREAYGKVLIAESHEPVHLTIYTFRPLPNSRPKSIISEPDTYKYDWDNIGKLVSDALNGCAYADDAQVTRATVSKMSRMRNQKERTLVTVAWGDDIVLLGGTDTPNGI